MLFSKTSLEVLNNSVEPFLKGDKVSGNIQSSSIDLTIESIFLPDNREIKKQNDVCNHGLEHYRIRAGETVIVQIAEEFKMPCDVGGIVFPRNKLSKLGLLMTNPGHIDPGFEGKITVCLINMARDVVTLKKDDTIISLLLFKTDQITPGIDMEEPSVGVSIEQLNSITKDFADISGRMKKMAIKQISKSAMFALAVCSIMLTILMFVLPLSFILITPPSVDEIKSGRINQSLIVPISDRVKTVESKLDGFFANRDLHNIEIKKHEDAITRLQRHIDNLNLQIQDMRIEIKTFKNRKK